MRFRPRAPAADRPAGALEPDELDALGQWLVQQAWLDPIYNQTSAANLIELLTHLWSVLPPAMLDAFVTHKLVRELAKPLSPGALRDAASNPRAVRAAGLLQVIGEPLPANRPTAVPFDPPAGTPDEIWMYWIGFAALTPTPPTGLPARPWTTAGLKSVRPWVAKALRDVERWAKT